jgi:iron(III) transport system ATP-binding protein
VSLCWRPESAIFDTTGITAKVVHRAFQGHFTDLIVETKGTSYRVQTKRTAAQEGDTIQFSVSPDEMILLDQDT